MKRYSNLLAMTFVLIGLAACGGGDDPAPVVVPQAIPPVSVPQPDYARLPEAGYDYVGSVIVPQLQALYGDIEVLGDVYILSPGAQGPINLRGRVLSWAQLYNEHIRGLAVLCNCYDNVYGIQRPTTGASFGGWASMNYEGFSGFISGGFGTGQVDYYHDWLRSDVVRLRARGQVTSFAAVINTLVYANYNIYYVYYDQYYQYRDTRPWSQFSFYGQYNDRWYRDYGYRPYGGTSVYGGFTYNRPAEHYGDSSWSVSLGGFINF